MTKTKDGMKKRYELMGSQKELLRMKRDEIRRTVDMAQELNRRLQENLNGMAVELGIPMEDLVKYRLSEDGSCFELVPPPPPPNKV